MVCCPISPTEKCRYVSVASAAIMCNCRHRTAANCLLLTAGVWECSVTMAWGRGTACFLVPSVSYIHDCSCFYNI
ncbi:hypothetical protein XELAEV_18002644mg [Xenopus laevis]|uniref:Uncharacterized protein n=1 Tax=Xenopus laevis TaxID=8355 RepID=A0A974BNI1_XENLA|nr:hypothetical protein XELAEV_18002644mg [Xenopus laevis]